MVGPSEVASSQGSPGSDDLEALLEAEFEEQVPAAPAAKRAKQASTCPPHPGYIGGICIRCGALKRSDEEAEPGSGGLALKYIHHGLEVTRSEALRLRAGTAQRALSARRLLLVLDLDHTLLNSTRFSDLTPQQTAALEAQLQAQPADAPMLHRLPHMHMWTRLRPGIRSFLAQAHELFDLHVYTMGDSGYAAGMAALLDPDGTLFRGRVASSRDAGPAGVKDLDVLLGADEVVLVLDDTSAVWPRHKGNLVQIDRYVYFPACAAKFGLGGHSLLEREEDEDAEQGALTVSLRVLTEVHTRCFSADEAGAPTDVRFHLRAVRQRVLAGCCILFSRIIPLEWADPTAHPLWCLAVEFGATCRTSPSAEVTHVVAADVTDKTRWAHAAGKHVVAPSWLWCSAFTWRRADESRFPALPSASAPLAMPGPDAELAVVLAAAGGGAGTGTGADA